MEKLGMWLLVLIAVVFLARPQGAAAVKEPQQIIASAECADEESDDGAIILLVVIIVIIIGAAANACEQEVTYENYLMKAIPTRRESDCRACRAAARNSHFREN